MTITTSQRSCLKIVFNKKISYFLNEIPNDRQKLRIVQISQAICERCGLSFAMLSLLQEKEAL